MITSDERAVLERFARRSRANRHLAFRARILLRSAAGVSNSAIARELRCAGATVGKWRKRFIEFRLDGLHDEPRPGVERTITDDQVENVVVRTLETKPKGGTHWSTRAMAKQVGLSHSSIGRIWRTFGLQPHRTKTFRLSEDPLSLAKTRSRDWTRSWPGAMLAQCPSLALYWALCAP